MSAAKKSDPVLWALWTLTVIILAMFVLMEAKTRMLNLGSAMHDAYCQDH